MNVKRQSGSSRDRDREKGRERERVLVYAYSFQNPYPGNTMCSVVPWDLICKTPLDPRPHPLTPARSCVCTWTRPGDSNGTESIPTRNDSSWTGFFSVKLICLSIHRLRGKKRILWMSEREWDEWMKWVNEEQRQRRRIRTRGRA